MKSALFATGQEHRTRVKLCGLFRDEDIDAAFRAKPDLCGFIVDFPRSHRSISPERLLRLCRRLERAENEAAEENGMFERVARVGVFVNKPAVEVARIAMNARLDAVQLHGNEDARYIFQLARLLESHADDARRAAPKIIQAFRVRGPDEIAQAAESPASLVLLDSGQGSGRTFAWSFAHGMKRPFILAGGLDPGNIAEAVRTVRPWGVDISSGIETNRLKDPKKMQAAVAAVRLADRTLEARPSQADWQFLDNSQERTKHS